MKFRQISILMLVVGLALGALGVVVAGQEEGERPAPERSQERLSMEERVERYVTSLKEELGSTDEQWKVLGPKLEALINARLELRRLYLAGFQGPRGIFARRRSSETPEEEKDTPESQLRKLLKDESAGEDVIQAKLAAVRAARKEEGKENKEKMKALRNIIAEQVTELKELLSIRQEAILSSCTASSLSGVATPESHTKHRGNGP